jgi:hypothetical protein
MWNYIVNNKGDAIGGTERVSKLVQIILIWTCDVTRTNEIRPDGTTDQRTRGGSL